MGTVLLSVIQQECVQNRKMLNKRRGRIMALIPHQRGRHLNECLPYTLFFREAMSPSLHPQRPPSTMGVRALRSGESGYQGAAARIGFRVPNTAICRGVQILTVWNEWLTQLSCCRLHSAGLANPVRLPPFAQNASIALLPVRADQSGRRVCLKASSQGTITA